MQCNVLLINAKLVFQSLVKSLGDWLVSGKSRGERRDLKLVNIERTSSAGVLLTAFMKEASIIVHTGKT